jgi:tRNA (cytidine/uridine-2'-O-)-methyltransferase
MPAHDLRLAAYQPDIPQNTGALMRLGVGFATPVDLIEPFGFPWDERKVRNSALDYFDYVKLTRHSSWNAFLETVGTRRIVLLTTKAAIPYIGFSFKADDILLVGRESAGVPDEVHDRADARVIIPMNPQLRSFNVAMSAGIVLSEAIRQLGQTE